MRLSYLGRWLGWFFLRHRLRAEPKLQAVTDLVRIAPAPILASCGVEVVSCPRLTPLVPDERPSQIKLVRNHGYLVAVSSRPITQAQTRACLDEFP